MYTDGCMYVYGGYSQRCEDFCGDMWFFDIYLQVGWESLSGRMRSTKREQNRVRARVTVTGSGLSSSAAPCNA